VLTHTNEEAMLLCGLLLQKGVKAQLIQSNDGFNLQNLYELRLFSDMINAFSDSPLVADEEWSEASRRLMGYIETSAQKNIAISAIRKFEEVNNAKKYKSDWKAFLFESKVEDFVDIDAVVVYLSTIHKAKGKEFDNLYLLLQHFKPLNDEYKRQFYVAVTRAKTNLNIYYQGSYLRHFVANGLIYAKDDNQYSEPQQITIHLTLRDVQLGYFEYIQNRINLIFSGSRLQPSDDGLKNGHGEFIVKYSQKFKTILQERFDQGFKIAAAKINFIVYWKDEEKQKESKIVLPSLLLKKD